MKQAAKKNKLPLGRGGIAIMAQEKRVYTMTIAGLKRDLPLCRLNEHMSIAAFVIFRGCGNHGRFGTGAAEKGAGIRCS